MSDVRYKPVILQEHDAESRRLRAILDTETDEIYIKKMTKRDAELLGITIEEETYICDPEKNIECKKTACQTMCFKTTNPRYRKEENDERQTKSKEVEERD